MKKFISLLFVLGFVLYLKPGLKFPDGSDSMRAKYASKEGVVMSVGQQGRIIKVVSDGGKSYYIPIENILCIIEE
jgi:hypothetical protein